MKKQSKVFEKMSPLLAFWYKSVICALLLMLIGVFHLACIQFTLYRKYWESENKSPAEFVESVEFVATGGWENPFEPSGYYLEKVRFKTEEELYYYKQVKRKTY